jgi:hypothetical protein
MKAKNLLLIGRKYDELSPVYMWAIMQICKGKVEELYLLGYNAV